MNEEGPWLMHDLEDDPYEMANLAHHTRWRKRRDELHGRLRELVASVGDEFAPLG